MASHTKINVEINLPQAKDRAIALIHQITSENVEKLSKLSLSKLITYLSNLMKCAEENILSLLRAHDQNQQLDPQIAATLGKLIAKGVIKTKKHTLGSIDEEHYNQIKFIMAQLGDLARFRADNGLGGQKPITADLASQKTTANITNSNTFVNSYQTAVAVGTGHVANLPKS